MPDAPTFGLAPLVAPLAADRFLAEHWPARHLVSRGPVERFAPLLEIPELADVEALARVYHDRVPVWFSSALCRDRLDQVYGTRFAARDALVLYRAGATLFFEKVDRWVAPLRPLARALERELSLAPGSVYVSAFASPGGVGSAAHFDPDLNFSVQLRGRKRWWIARNAHVAEPTAGYSVLEGGTPESDELRGYCPGPLPREMPNGAEQIDMEPGTALFLPRGTWHATEAVGEESFALVFAINPVTWAQLVATHLVRRLCAEPRWREHVHGIGGERPHLAAARARLRELIAALPSALADLDPDAMLDELAGTSRWYRRVPAPARLERQRPGAPEPWVLVVDGDEVRRELWLAEGHAAACAWTLDRQQPFCPPDLAAATSIDLDDAAAVLDTLVDLGVLATA